MPLRLLLTALLTSSLSLFAQSVTLNSAWQFTLNDTLSLAGAQQWEEWETLNLPHTWNARDPFDEADGYHMGVGWYRKTLFFAKNGRDQISLYFEGANEQTTVWLNGQKVTTHLGGYTAFEADLSPYIEWGEENELLLRVSNRVHPAVPPLSMDFTFYGGIYRDVWLNRRAPQHFDPAGKAAPGVILKTTEVSAKRTTLAAEIVVRNVADAVAELEVQLKVFDPAGKLAGEQTQALNVPGEGHAQVDLDLRIARPQLWSPKTPVLYRVEITLVKASSGQVFDHFSQKYGFRWVELDEDRQFLLNGEPLKLIGTCRHQDHPDFGSALPNALHRQDVALLKQMGGNFLRTSHYPHDPEVYAACDELGILVWTEIPIVNSTTVSDSFRLVSTQMLEEMIAQHRNHPSVIMWGIANEVLLRLNNGLKDNPQLEEAAYLDSVRALMQHLHDRAKALDPVRWTTIAHHGDYDRYEKAGLNDITDIVGWNLYYGWYSADMPEAGAFLDRFHREHPDKGIIVSEYGGGADPRLHAIDPLRFDFTVEWQTDIHTSYLSQIQARPHILGSTLWNLADFNSEGRKDAVPHINSKGILNLDRSPKDSYLFYQAALTEAPFLAIGSRGWRLRAGFLDETGTLTQPVYVFSNADSLHVSLNGEALGNFRPEQQQVKLPVPFVPGKNVLKVEAGGQVQTAVFQVDAYPADLRQLRPEAIDLKMNLGAHFFFVDPVERAVWLPEQAYAPGGIGYVGGNRYLTWGGVRVGGDREIFGTDNEPLYQTLRDSLEAFKADLPAGHYELELHIAELVGQEAREKLAYNLGAEGEEALASGPRRFHLRVNGELRLLDAVLVDYQATVFRLPVEVDDAGLTVEVVPLQGAASLSAVAIRGR